MLFYAADRMLVDVHMKHTLIINTQSNCARFGGLCVSFLRGTKDIENTIQMRAISVLVKCVGV